MREITPKNLDIFEHQADAEMSQTDTQYGGCYAAIYVFGKAVVYIADNGADTSYYLLDTTERVEAKKDPQAKLKEFVEEWSSNDDDPMSSYAWELTSPEDHEVSGEFEGECRIVVRGNFYGYYPHFFVDPVADEIFGLGEGFIFKKRKDAQEWIDEQDSRDYYLASNEAGRPDYFIVEA